MSNEDFQKLVLEKLSGIETDVKEIKNQLNAVYEQTANLTEFRTESNSKLDALIENNKSIHEILGEHEISIRTLRRKPV